MNQAHRFDYNIDKKKKNGMWQVVFFLLLFVLATGILLCLRIGIFTYTYAKEADTVIPVSSVAPEDRGLSGGSSFVPKPGFQIKDDNQPWNDTTEIELFRVTYVNGEKVITATGRNGQKIVAPGTENEYTFHLTNTGNVAMDYQMAAAAILFDGETSYPIPLNIRLSDYTGRYLVGSENEWVPFEAINRVTEKATLGVNRYTAYTIEWQWPFESGNDEFDTLLGNLALDRDLVLRVTIQVNAERNPNPNEGGGIPQTGDDFSLWFYISLAAVSAVSLILLVFFWKGKKAVSDGEK